MLSSSAESGMLSKRFSTPPLQIESERCPSIPPGMPVKKSHNSSSYNATTDSTSTTSTRMRMRKDRANRK